MRVILYKAQRYLAIAVVSLGILYLLFLGVDRQQILDIKKLSPLGRPKVDTSSINDPGSNAVNLNKVFSKQDYVDLARSRSLEDHESTEYCRKFYDWQRHVPHSTRRRVYDLFLVDHELDWLEIRMDEMYDFVDFFVLVEGTHSFTGFPKPLYFSENRKRFAKYEQKVIYYTLNHSTVTDVEFTDTWSRERYSRDSLFTHVFPILKDNQKPNFNDVIIVSDLDEILNSATVLALRYCEWPSPTSLHTGFYYYSFDVLAGDKWPFPQATLFVDMNNTVLPDTLRHTDWPHAIVDAGWHCSWCFERMSDLLEKFRSWPHTEWATPEKYNATVLASKVLDAVDLLDRGSRFTYVNNPDNLPSLIKSQPERFAHLRSRNCTNACFIDLDDDLKLIQT